MTLSPADLSIKAVTTLTGLNESTIRAWERRYGAVRPQRTPTGRRRYSFLDVDRLRLLAQLTESGQAIGDIAALTDRELGRRLARLEVLMPEVAPDAAAARRERDAVDDVAAIS